MRDPEPPGQGLHASVISRIKIMAGLDIAERRLPQDGRIRVTSRRQEIGLRRAVEGGSEGGAGDPRGGEGRIVPE